MAYLVIGANGFLGRQLARHFHTAGQTLVGLDRHPAQAPELFAAWEQTELPADDLSDRLAAHRPAAILYATGTAQVGASVDTPFMDFDLSVRLWASTLEAVRQSGVRCPVVFFSSAAVYGNAQALPIAEDTPLRPISPYGYHKVMCEQLAEYYARLYQMQVCSLRVFSAYGEGLKRQVLWDICRKALSGPTLELHGTGRETRDFIHATDIAQAVETVLRAGDFDAGVYNVASGQGTAIATVAAHLVSALRRDLPIRFNGLQRPGDPLYWQANIGRLRALGFAPRVDLFAGAQAYARWAQAELRHG